MGAHAPAAAEERVPRGRKSVRLRISGKDVRLSNLEKVFWPGDGRTKGDLLRFYERISDHVIPHLRDRAMVMKRYPDGIAGESFYMKRTPSHAPDWVPTCTIEHSSGNVIDFPVVGDLPTLLWIVNLGCIDLHPWYARCDDTDRPDLLNFDLDPVEVDQGDPPVPFERVLEAALVVREALEEAGIRPLVKTSGSRGVHLYVPIVRGPRQKAVWTVAKALAQELASRRPDLLTAEYRIAKRPAGRVLVDYNQNAWGRTLASVYSVRPRPGAPVSTPLTWEEVERGVSPGDFTIDTVPERLDELGDLWLPLRRKRGRFDLARIDPEPAG